MKWIQYYNEVLVSMNYFIFTTDCGGHLIYLQVVSYSKFDMPADGLCCEMWIFYSQLKTGENEAYLYSIWIKLYLS